MLGTAQNAAFVPCYSGAMKVCSKCRVSKSVTAFYLDNSRRDKLQPHCIDCMKAAQRDWYKRHADERRAYEATRDPEHKREISRESSRRCRARDPEAARRNVKAWKVRHPEQAREVARLSASRYRAKHHGCRGKHDTAEVLNLVSSYLGLCVYCDAEYAHLDHVEPVARGGADDIDNIVPACARCNQRKQSRSLLAFMLNGGMRKAAR